ARKVPPGRRSHACAASLVAATHGCAGSMYPSTENRAQRVADVAELATHPFDEGRTLVGRRAGDAAKGLLVQPIIQRRRKVRIDRPPAGPLAFGQEARAARDCACDPLPQLLAD